MILKFSNIFLTGEWEIEIIKKVIRTDEVKEVANIEATLIGEIDTKMCCVNPDK